jgi:short-subunit dehydrogenase
MTAGWALVTGACSGIGLELARELARRGYPLVLVSNREPELRAVTRQIADEHNVAIQTVAMDLARPDAAFELYEDVRRRGLEVEVLVSNAGVFFFGEVADADPAKANAMLQLHVVTPSLLARYFAHDMRARRRGYILIVSSISAWRDFPGIAWYGSSKRYLRSFAASLREELRVWDINVTCLAPGAVATNLYDRTTVPVRTAVKYGVMKDPARVAEAGVQGMFRGKAVVVPGLSAKLMVVAMALMPQWIIRLVRTRSPLLPRPGDRARRPGN